MKAPTRDLIVIGASMGGIEALSQLAATLPEDLAAAVLVVQHTSAESPGTLHEILGARGKLPVVRAEDGMAVQQGRIHVAAPDRHLLLSDDTLHVVHGPRENRSRPAIDPLFRTAAVTGRSRVLGVILTGLLGDGASGLRAVQRCGGLTVVQSDAVFPDMPRQAAEVVAVDHHVPLAELAPLLGRLAGTPAPDPPSVPDDLALEAQLTHRAMTDGSWLDLPGRPTTYTCPECGGVLNQTHGDRMRRYRCHTGHAFSEQALLDGQVHATEAALWAALRIMEERVSMLEGMGRDSEADRSGYLARADEAREHAAAIRQLLR
jgi:two-component system chemotaxis response regulator CheB